MPFYLAVYLDNEVVTVIETTLETEEKTISHEDGLLIFAVVEAETGSEAQTMAAGIGLRQRDKTRA